MSSQQNTFIEKILGDEFLSGIFDEFGVAEGSPETQEAALTLVGEMIYGHVILEILLALQKPARDELEALQKAGDAQQVEAFLRGQIPDLDAFIRHEATKQYEQVKSSMRQMAEGVSSGGAAGARGLL